MISQHFVKHYQNWNTKVDAMTGKGSFSTRQDI